MTQDTNAPNKPDYRDTVFLPKTDFPMRGGLPQKEPEILAQWDAIDLYGQMRKKAAPKGKFVLHDGPPYANGNIHMGHAVNKILKDVVVKSYGMMGYDAPYVPGWDCHGLPIEWKVEEKYRAAGKDKDDVPVLEFREECRQFAQSWVDIQSAQFQRLGVTGEWSNPYRTMTNRAESMIAAEIHKFALNGGLYKGLRPVMWSTVEKTALADAEVEYHEHKSVTCWVKFPVMSSPDEDLLGTSVVIWTTTPWTLPSNRAISYGENVEYALYLVRGVTDGSKAMEGEILVLARALTESIKTQAKIAELIEIKEISAQILQETICRHPLDGKGYNFDVPLLQGDFVTDETGTGFVHIAPAHGEDDFNLGRQHGIEITDNVTDDGKFRPHVSLFAGEEIYTQDGKLGAGNFSVLRELEAANGLLAKGSIKHDYPHSWRSKAPVIFRAVPQWFIAMDGQGKIREKALAAIKDTGWIPAKGEARITAMIENRPDWCISRQRAWGVPIALFLHKDTGEILNDPQIYAAIAKAFEEEGADAWYKDGVEKRFLGDKADQYTKVNDIVDVWFESGSTHQFVVGDTLTWPCYEGVEKIDLYLEGSDQHRGWFHSSLLESCGTRGEAPYKNVLTHGFVLDEKGYKMSKSLGNVVDPLKMMEEHGADIIRLWVMLSDYQEDIRIGKDTLKNTGDLYRRMRNTLRFLLGALDGFTAEEAVFRHPDQGVRRAEGSLDYARDDIAALPELERYMLHKLYEANSVIESSIHSYSFGVMAKYLHHFCNDDLSAFYFDIRKDMLYCDSTNDFKRRACRTVMAEIFSCLTAWLAPILAFTAEEAWSHRPKGAFEDAASVHLRDFPTVPAEWNSAELALKFALIKDIRDGVLAQIEPKRASKEIGSSLEADVRITAHSTSYYNAIKDIDMAEICIVSSCNVEMGTEGAGATIEVTKASGEKCERCWKVLPEVTAESGHLCNRCSDAVAAQKNSEAA